MLVTRRRKLGLTSGSRAPLDSPVPYQSNWFRRKLATASSGMTMFKSFGASWTQSRQVLISHIKSPRQISDWPTRRHTRFPIRTCKSCSASRIIVGGEVVTLCVVMRVLLAHLLHIVSNPSVGSGVGMSKIRWGLSLNYLEVKCFGLETSKIAASISVEVLR